MKLFLSSENLGNYADEFVALVGSKKLAYIGNAKDDLVVSDRQANVEEHRSQFASLGIDFTEIDLREYFGRLLQLESVLEEFGAIWCAGGNTFLLRSAFQQSGMDNLLIEKVNNEEIVYGGSSAGAVLTGPTLKGTENGDNPEDVSVIYNQDVNWSGLGLVNYVVVPHFKSDWFGESANNMVDYLTENNIPYKVLRDGQVILIDGEKESFLS